MIKNADKNMFLNKRVDNLYSQPMLKITLFQVVMILLTTWYLWTPESKKLMLGWLILRFAVNFFTVFIFKKYRNAPERNEQYKVWLALFSLISVTNAILWGVVAVFPNVFDSPNNVMFLGILLLGVVAAALPVMSNFTPLFAAFSSIILFPITVQFFYSDEGLYNIFGFMFLAYIGVQILSSYNLQNVLINSFRLGLENIELIDNLKIKNRQAEEAREYAEHANSAKSKFLAAASHDLRQPLHALGLFVSKINNNQRYPEIKNDIENIKKSSDALDGLLNALLDISKLDAGVLQPKLSFVSLQNILNKVTTHGKSHAQDKGLIFRMRDMNATIQTDPLMMERILNNLVSNAIRYTNSGTVFIGCRKRGNKIRIEVRDSGIGIAKDKLGEIFEEFYQAENPERDRSKGLGLGLAIVERLCSLLDYKVDVHTAPGKGSVFAVEVPCIQRDALPETAMPSSANFISDVQGMCVLVIDDEEMIRKGMAAMLEGWECTSLLAESADSATSQLEQTGFTPDIIISDYRLRENKTGAQAIKQVNDFLQKNIPAIIVTGDTAPNRLQEAKDSGYQLLHKPVAPAKLRSVMSYLREQSPT